MAGGRPSKYDPKFCDQLLDHLSEGYSFEAFAGVIKVNHDTLHEWCKKHKEFSDTKRLGQSIARKLFEKLGFGLITGKLKGSAAVYIFTMKNRFGWQDTPSFNDDDGELEFI